jgi:hypothetical protein
LKLDNWSQEKYVSCLSLYDLYKLKNEVEQGIYYLIQSYSYDNNRVEGIYHLIQHYCILNQPVVAYSFYMLIQNYYENDYINDTFENKLFLEKDIFAFFFPYYMIIICERLKKYDIGLKMYNIIIAKGNIDVNDWYINNLVHNLQFFIGKNTDKTFQKRWDNYLSIYNKR